ncbi:zinc finger protein 569 [Cephus cinctus]|uniref:Zinc finger protein 569 n=1 Tax=Cephus cinctus TaxID=211228 RepID=A0AAJ7BS02_CEPCN|nr:zinc finger protein 569 [Cephus cinctus]XP_015592844.1 zinc finger protein 569 [Cephus cinctus]XP_024939590.1 zinc finger protein 569 [Cephus cinctus]
MDVTIVLEGHKSDQLSNIGSSDKQRVKVEVNIGGDEKCLIHKKMNELETNNILYSDAPSKLHNVVDCIEGYRDIDPCQVECFLSDIPKGNQKENLSETNLKKLPCHLCNMQCNFCSTHELLKHLNKVHNINIINEKYICTCKEVLYDLVLYKEHIAKCRDNQEIPKTSHMKNIIENIKEENALIIHDRIYEEENKGTNELDLIEKSNLIICYVCYKLFPCKTYFTSHLKPKHPNIVCDENWDGICYKCKKCATAYPSLVLVREHFLEVHNIIYRCSKCHDMFKNKKLLKKHYKYSHETASEKSQGCNACGKELNNLKALRTHIKMKHGRSNRQGFRCRLCEDKFHTKEDRKLHYEKIHCGESPFICMDCGKGFSSKSGLYGHRQLHKKDQQSTCQYCGKIFNRRDSYHEHVLIHVGPRHRCPYCPKEFVQRSNLIRHIRIHTGQKPYSCTFCEKRFSDKGACNSHIRVHTKEEQCACSYCGQVFTKKQKLKYHIRKHTGEGLLSCEICAKTFTNTFALKEHRTIHDRQTQMMCIECGRAFSNQKYLERHMATVHPGPESLSFICPICDKVFYQQSRLKYHIVTHTEKKYFDCELCGKRYSTRKSMQNHLQRYHDLQSNGLEYKSAKTSMLEEVELKTTAGVDWISKKDGLVAEKLLNGNCEQGEIGTTDDGKNINFARGSYDERLNDIGPLANIESFPKKEDKSLLDVNSVLNGWMNATYKQNLSLTSTGKINGAEKHCQNNCDKALNLVKFTAQSGSSNEDLESSTSKVLITQGQYSRNEQFISDNQKIINGGALTLLCKRGKINEVKSTGSNETVNYIEELNANSSKVIYNRRKYLTKPKKYVPSINVERVEKHELKSEFEKNRIDASNVLFE